MTGAKVYVGSKLCGTLGDTRNKAVLHVSCPANTKGNFVKVVLPRNWLHICEIEVYGSYADEKNHANTFLDNSRCLSACPVGKYENLKDFKCDKCHSTCRSCSGPNTN